MVFDVFGPEQCQKKVAGRFPTEHSVNGVMLVKHVLVLRFHIRIRECKLNNIQTESIPPIQTVVRYLTRPNPLLSFPA